MYLVGDINKKCREEINGWCERLHSFRSLDALMEGKPSGKTGKDIQWIPISRGLGLTVSLACLGNHEGHAWLTWEGSTSSARARVGVCTFSCAMRSSQMMWVRSSDKCFGKMNKPDFGKRLKAD